MRLTKIIATIGPATSSTEGIRALIDHGVDICRLNFSHGDHAAHAKVIARIRAVNRGRACPVGIMLDTKGPEVRTGDVDTPITIRRGDHVVFTANPSAREKMKVIRVDYDKFSHDVRSAKRILLDNGAIEFTVEEIHRDRVIAKALQDGKVGSRRHVNLPGAHISLPSFTKKDWGDIRFGITRDVDFIAVSFVRTAAEIGKLRAMLKKHGSAADIIAKIETPQAVENIGEIIDAADAIMVARGDLGAEVPFEKVPRIQDAIVGMCRAKAKPVIVATHMLESMILSPMPTRAEITDIAHAAVSGTDCTMLSGETASGLYPVRAIDAMDRILRANECAEGMAQIGVRRNPTALTGDLPRAQQARSASLLAATLHAGAMVVISKHGLTARAVSNCRPPVPMFVFTDSADIQRKLSIVWGVRAYHISFDKRHPEKTVSNALTLIRTSRLLPKGKRVVIVSDIRSGATPVMTVQIRQVT